MLYANGFRRPSKMYPAWFVRETRATRAGTTWHCFVCARTEYRRYWTILRSAARWEHEVALITPVLDGI